MKRALLLYAKQKFSEMKSCHEQQQQQQQSTGGEKSSPSFQLAAPISPTPNAIIETFLPHLHLDSNSLLIDLGCGDGRWLLAAHESTQCHCLGVDVDEERLQMARESIQKNQMEEWVQVRHQDVFEFVRECEEMERANVIVVYLFREAMIEIGRLLRQRLVSTLDWNDDIIEQSKVQILSVGFALPFWTCCREERINGIRVYLYSTAS